jgi:hypothetical protein
MRAPQTCRSPRLAQILYCTSARPGCHFDPAFPTQLHPAMIILHYMAFSHMHFHDTPPTLLDRRRNIKVLKIVLYDLEAVRSSFGASPGHDSISTTEQAHVYLDHVLQVDGPLKSIVYSLFYEHVTFRPAQISLRTLNRPIPS